MNSKSGNLIIIITWLTSLTLLTWPVLGQAQQQGVQITEVAWAGTNASASDEYLELKGPAGQDLTNWRLEADDGLHITPAITLTGIISTTGFYVLERTNDDTVASLNADQIYTGGLSDDGEHLKLYDEAGNLVDEINALNGWPAGDKSPNRAALERLADGTFVTNDCVTTSGAIDVDGGTICGSPGAENQAPQPVSSVQFVHVPSPVPPGESRPFVAQAWNSQSQPPEGSTMRFSIVSSGTDIIGIDPLTATINASGQATVTVTGLTTGTAVIVAQWFGNLGGTEVKVELPIRSPGENGIFLPVIFKGNNAGE